MAPMPTSGPPNAFRLPRMQEAGLLVVILIIGLLLTFAGGSITVGGEKVNNFLRASNLLGGVATPMSVYAIMAVGVTFVIIAGGIDISVGSIFALSAIATAAVLQNFPEEASAWKTIPVAVVVSCGIGLACGLINGALVVGLRMHPFIVTLGTMGIFRCLCSTGAELTQKGFGHLGLTKLSAAAARADYKTLPAAGGSLPPSFTDNFMMYEIPKKYVGVAGLQPMPILIALACVALGWVYLSVLVAGRENYAIGGNEEAARFSGLPVNRIKLRVFALCGLAAGIAGLVSVGYFGSASANTGSGYELTVIAAAVVGGASLTGGRGTALGALLGALVIKLIENGIFILQWNQAYSLGIVGISIILAVAVDRLSEFLRNKRLAGAKQHL
jgi:ribose/xylose/arabinose/galactoside ABC-type transport system permease subunit